MVFGQQVSEGLIGKFPHALPAVAGQQIERPPVSASKSISLRLEAIGLLPRDNPYRRQSSPYREQLYGHYALVQLVGLVVSRRKRCP
jgi:hypothetical protein